jgi:hypothetical protein
MFLVCKKDFYILDNGEYYTMNKNVKWLKIFITWCFNLVEKETVCHKSKPGYSSKNIN